MSVRYLQLGTSCREEGLTLWAVVPGYWTTALCSSVGRGARRYFGDTRRESPSGRRVWSAAQLVLKLDGSRACPPQVKRVKEGEVFEGEFFSPLAAYLPGMLPKESEVARCVDKRGKFSLCISVCFPSLKLKLWCSHITTLREIFCHHTSHDTYLRTERH